MAPPMVRVSFTIPAGTNLNGQLQLWMQIHGLRYQTQASVNLNNSGWMPINNNTVTLLGQANAYGGIGGGFHTLTMTMNLPAGSLVSGSNAISFRFNGTDGRVSGFRVLAFNVQNAGGNMLLPSSTFVNDDPNTWQAPSTSASDIATGQTLWHQAALTVPTPSGAQPIKAHCADCHAQDGRDSKYFNYSNNSIQARSLFHGLTAQQGDQIASYIRSLNVPNPGRPWNPPYQPGPGLDSQPVANWSAGAGLSAVLNSDQDLMNELFPTGVQANFFSQNGVLNVRETAIALQLPDWNSWLPTIHPMDAWSDFSGSLFNQRYGQLRTMLQPDNPTTYSNSATYFDLWTTDYLNFSIPKVNVDSSVMTVPYANNLYATAQWVLVKSWELNQEFQLEGMARAVFLNPRAESRAWRTQAPFFASPNMLHIPRTLGALDNGAVSTWAYLAFVWYHTQLILDNSEYQQGGTTPIDWPYVYDFISELSQNDSQPQVGLFTLWLTKAIQISNNGAAPNVASGWHWLNPDVSREVSPGNRGIWAGTSSATRSAIYNGIVQAWLTQIQQFTPQQLYGDQIDGTSVPQHGQPDSPNFADRVWYMIPQFRYYGVSQTLINQVAAWAQTVWPNGNWTLPPPRHACPTPPTISPGALPTNKTVRADKGR